VSYVGRSPNEAFFTPNGKEVWVTARVFYARPPCTALSTLDTGPITNHVNFARNSRGMFAYVTIGGLNQVKVYRTTDFSQIATIPVGS
jgi:DNA-binding beta-propeller fold protein YncE